MYQSNQASSAQAAADLVDSSPMSITAGKKLFLFSDNKEHSPFHEMLTSEGFRIHEFQQKQLSVECFAVGQPDLMLIDYVTPSMELISRCRNLRFSYAGPILVLAEQADEMLQILGLEMGADDFLLKPMSPSLLLAKIRATLRRVQELQQNNRKIIQLGQLVIDAGRREVRSHGSTVELTTREFDVLWCLAENSRKVLSRDDIHKYLYNSEYNGFDRSIDIYISRIRSKIGDDPLHPRYLKTIRGAGYLLTGDGHQ
ncbi:response regulator transcription factor [Pelobacter seleniigenes]|uniref:response regulator transcription factor n=1 Tax=Pelobacter seleniigenes TaxID=407188 RepID=UPI000691E46B|nr:response regulator transcription factor [Pelobacter seleniigenes]